MKKGKTLLDDDGDEDEEGLDESPEEVRGVILQLKVFPI